MHFPSSRGITAHGIGRKEIYVTITSGGDYYRVSRVAFYFSSYKVTSDDSTCLTIYDNHVHHLVTVVHIYLTTGDLSVHGRISPQEELLPCLSFGIESTGYEYSTKRTVVEEPAVITSKRHPLSYTLVYDISRDLSQAIYIGLTRAVVTPFYGVVEEAIGRVTISHIVFSGIDTPLCSDRVRTTRRVLVSKSLYIVPKLGKGSSGRASCQSCSYHNNVNITFVGRVYKVDMVFIFCPFVRNWSIWYFRI